MGRSSSLTRRPDHFAAQNPKLGRVVFRFDSAVATYPAKTGGYLSAKTAGTLSPETLATLRAKRDTGWRTLTRPPVGEVEMAAGGLGRNTV